MLSIVCRCKCAASGASSVGPTMRRRETVERRRRQNSFTFSGGDYHHGGGAGRKQRTYSRTRAPQLSPRYQLLNTLASSAPPSDSQPMSAVLHFQTLPAGELHRPGSPYTTPTSTAAASTRHPILQSTAVLTLIVVASLSLIVGAIYLLIYFKSIKPMSARSRNYMQAAVAGASGGGGGGGGGKMADDDGGRTRSTHPFFRRS